jgi:hypothetical protein
MLGQYGTIDKPYYSKEELDSFNDFDEVVFSTAVLEDNNEISSTNSNIIMGSNKNNFNGWKCSIGITRLLIDEVGDIYKGTCLVDGKIGDIHSGFEKPTEFAVCNKTKCRCGPEIQLDKFKESEDDLIKLKNGVKS